LCKVIKEPPKIIKNINDKMEPVFKKLGFQGHYHTELRVTKDGKAYYTDCTARAGSPNAEILCEGYDTYPEDVAKLANGEMPESKPKEEFVYAAEIILVSEYHDKKEICVKYPKEFKANVKLKNNKIYNGLNYCIPNDNDGYFGAAVAFGKTSKEAMERVQEIAKSVKTEDIRDTSGVFDKMNEQIEGGKKFGIEL